MDNLTHILPVVTLQPLREFHIEHGQGRTVAVLFRVAVDHHRAYGSSGDQQHRDQQAQPRIGDRT